MKGGLRKAGIRPPQGVQPKPVQESREYRKVPEERLMARLGLTKYDKDAPMDEKVAAILEFMEGLTEAQRDLVYDHLGAWKYLEDVRREEEARTGKTVTQQAISNRWNKIIAKGCKHFGVEKSRKRKK